MKGHRTASGAYHCTLCAVFAVTIFISGPLQPTLANEASRVRAEYQSLREATLDDVSIATRKEKLELALAILRNKGKRKMLSPIEVAELETWCARQAFMTEQFTKTVKILEEGSTKNADRLAILTRANLMLNRVERAKTVATEGLTMARNSAERTDLYNLLAQCFSRTGQPENEIKALLSAASCSPKNIDTKFGLAVALSNAGRVNEIGSLLDDVEIVRNSNSTDTLCKTRADQLLLVARAYRVKHDLEKEQSLLLKACKCATKTEVLPLLIKNLLDQNRANELMSLSESAKYDSNDLRAYAGCEYASRHQNEKARAMFTQLTAETDTATMLKATRVESQAGLLDLAERHVQLLLHRQMDPEISLLASDIFMRRGHFKSALQILDPAIRASQTSERALAKQARLFLVTGDDTKAEATLCKLQQLYPDRHYTLTTLNWGMSREFLANLDSFRLARAKMVKTFLSDIEATLAVVEDGDERNRLLITQAKCQLLMHDGKGCMNTVDKLFDLGIKNDTVRCLRASAMDIVGDRAAAEKERDIVLEHFVKSGANPLKLDASNHRAP